MNRPYTSTEHLPLRQSWRRTEAQWRVSSHLRFDTSYLPHQSLSFSVLFRHIGVWPFMLHEVDQDLHADLPPQDDDGLRIELVC